MSETPFIDADLYGFFAPDFAWDEPVVARLEDLATRMPMPDRIGKTRVHDARHLQHQEANFSEARFFEDHGFVLLDHESAVANWDLDPKLPEADQEVARIYQPEAEELVRTRLMPGRKIEVHQGVPARRGPGTPMPDYGAGVHQDYGTQPQDFEEGLLAFTTEEIARGWRTRFEQDDVIGFTVVNLWRTVYASTPLHHMPLAVCDPHTVRFEDAVPLHLLDFAPTGRPTNQLSLRSQPDQRWYYYPDMTHQEVLAFKNFEFMKNQTDPQIRSCFHTAFEEPGAPADAEIRQSCEHRLSVFLLRE